LSIAYYLILEDRNPLSRFPKWAATHKHPHGKNIPSQRSSELFAFVTEDAKEHSLQEELERGKRNSEHEKQYAKYFDVKTTPVRGVKFTAKEETIVEAKKNYGRFVFLSNDVKDPIEALEIYRNKDLVEKAFGNLKERLNFSRPAVSSDQSLDGKLFVEFIALIYLSYIKKMMQDKNLFKKYTMQELLDEFDIIECFEQPGRELRVGEVTKRQIELYEEMEIEPPTSLH